MSESRNMSCTRMRANPLTSTALHRRRPVVVGAAPVKASGRAKRLTSFLAAAVLFFSASAMIGCVSQPSPPITNARTQDEAFLLRHTPATPPVLAFTPSVWERRERELMEAQRLYDENPTDEHAIIWLGRQSAYFGLYEDAIDVFSRGLELHPESARLLRHRGHRFITLRRFDLALDDLARAAAIIADQPDEIEADGVPNPSGIPRSTLKTNIYYHLGLAHYFKKEFTGARAALETCLQLSPNDDMRIASIYWLYLSLRQLDLDADARILLASIPRQMEILENFAYDELLQRFTSGLGSFGTTSLHGNDTLSGATVAYGLAMYDFFRGFHGLARRELVRIARQGHPAAFGTIAAEVEIQRWCGSDTPAPRQSSGTSMTGPAVSVFSSTPSNPSSPSNPGISPVASGERSSASTLPSRSVTR